MTDAAALAAAKAYLRIADDGEDAVLGQLIGSALGLCEAFTGQVPVVRAVDEVLPVSPEWRRLWDTLGQHRAELVPDGAGRATAGRWVATVRTPSEAAAGDRLLWTGRKLLVRHVWHDPRRPDRIEIFCEETR